MIELGWRACAVPALLAAGLFSAGFGGPQPPALSTSSPVQDAMTGLQRDIDRALDVPALQQGACAVLVRSLSGDDTLYSLNAGKLLLPSSTMKVITLGAAADRLGWDYTFDTLVAAGGPIQNGVLEGDLIITGNGDPSIDNWDGDATRLFQEWADALKAAGIRTIKGRIVGDDHAFDHETIGAGWMWDDLDRSFATGVGALQFNENTAQITIVPGAGIGEHALVTASPPSAEVRIRDQITTGARGTAVSIETERHPGDAVLDVRGSIPLGAKPIVRNVSVLNSTRYFLNELRASLVADGIDVAGDAVDVDDTAGGPPSAPGATLIEHHSAPLGTLAETMMRLSQNLYAETLLKALGRSAGTPASSGGISIVRSILEGWGIPATGYIQVDGSGLSRYDYVTAETLVAALTHIDRDPRLRDGFRSVLPMAGRAGTLENRMKGTPAEGNVRAKTGSMSNARALAGYMSDSDGEPLVFTVIANNFGASSEAGAAVDRAVDAIIVRLARFSRKQQ